MLIGGLAGVGSCVGLLHVGNYELIETQIILVPNNLDPIIGFEYLLFILVAAQE